MVEPSPEGRSKSAKELAHEYEVSDRTVQTWFKTVTTAYPWIDPSALKTGKSAKTRYTPLCQALLAEYRDNASVLSEEDWIASVHAANPEQGSAREPEVTEAELVEAPGGSKTGSVSATITVSPSKGTIAVHQVNQIHLTVINTQSEVDQALTHLQATLKQWSHNTSDLESALLQNAENKGSELGAKVAIAKVNKFVQTAEPVETALAEQLGLLGKPTVVPDTSPLV